jgi:hypothetical protein
MKQVYQVPAIFHSITTVQYTMNTIKTVLTTTILTLFLANCVQLDFIVNCKTVGQNKNIKENKEAPDKSWSVTIANQDTYKSSISTTSMMVLTKKTKTIKYDRLVFIVFMVHETVVIEWKIAVS